jgi:hypothetical protein
MNNSARASLLTLIFAVSSVAAAPGNGTFLVGIPTPDTDPVQVKSFELLGGSSGGKWLSDDTLKVNPSSYTLWNLAGSAGSVKGATKVSYDVPCPDTYSVNVTPAPSRADWWIAVNAAWNPRPRAVTVLPNGNATYQGVVREFLTRKGLKNPKVSLDRVVRADIDGDKQDEIIIAATNFKEGTGLFPPAGGQAGDYGLLLVRKIVGGKLQTIELGVEVFLSATTIEQVEKGEQNNPDNYALVNVLDLNGDGRMEIVMFNAIYEDYGVFVMEWDGKKFQQRLVTGCGA